MREGQRWDSSCTGPPRVKESLAGEEGPEDAPQLLSTATAAYVGTFDRHSQNRLPPVYCSAVTAHCPFRHPSRQAIPCAEGPAKVVSLHLSVTLADVPCRCGIWVWCPCCCSFLGLVLPIRVTWTLSLRVHQQSGLSWSQCHMLLTPQPPPPPAVLDSSSVEHLVGVQTGANLASGTAEPRCFAGAYLR